MDFNDLIIFFNFIDNSKSLRSKLKISRKLLLKVFADIRFFGESLKPFAYDRFEVMM